MPEVNSITMPAASFKNRQNDPGHLTGWIIRDGHMVDLSGNLLLPPSSHPIPNSPLIQLPHLRAWLIFYLQGFADKQYQLDHWVDATTPHAFWDNMHTPLTFTEHLWRPSLESKPEDLVGTVLYDVEELSLLARFREAIISVTIEVGIEQPDKDYLECRFWDDVVETAQAAYDAFVKKDTTLI